MNAQSPKQPDLTRARILKSAFEEIHMHGFQAASLKKILADTKLTKGALYHHFPTKHALGLAVIDEVISRRFDESFCTPLRESAHPVDTLIEIFATAEKILPSDFIELGCPLNNLIQEMSAIDQEIQQHLAVVLENWRSTVESALRDGQKQGQLLPDVDCKAASLFIVSAWWGCRSVAKNLQSLDTFRACVQQLQNYISNLRRHATTR